MTLLVHTRIDVVQHTAAQLDACERKQRRPSRGDGRRRGPNREVRRRACGRVQAQLAALGQLPARISLPAQIVGPTPSCVSWVLERTAFGKARRRTGALGACEIVVLLRRVDALTAGKALPARRR